jgi:hypothetical protein
MYKVFYFSRYPADTKIPLTSKGGLYGLWVPVPIHLSANLKYPGFPKSFFVILN